jgi:hypothetical protein
MNRVLVSFIVLRNRFWKMGDTGLECLQGQDIDVLFIYKTLTRGCRNTYGGVVRTPTRTVDCGQNTYADCGLWSEHLRGLWSEHLQTTANYV